MTDLETLKQKFDLTFIRTGNKIYDSRISAFKKYCDSRNIKADLDGLRIYVEDETFSASTKKLTKTAIKKAVEKVYENHPELLRELDENFKSIKTGKKNSISISPDDCYTDEEINLIIDRLNSKKPSKKYNTDLDRFKKLSFIIWTLFNTGLRISELIGIRMDKIHLNGNAKITILGKGNKERVILLPRKKVEEIKTLFNSKIYLFENKNGEKYNRVNLHKFMKKEIELVYPEKSFHPHLLRHSFGTHQIITKKKSVKAISKYMGHSSTAITQDLYVHDSIGYDDLFDE